MDITTKKKVMVISGAQGSGKTTMAIKKAKESGSFESVGFYILESPFRLANLLSKSLDTIIIDELIATEENVDFIAKIASSDTVFITPQSKKAQVVKTPKFIVCTNDVDTANLFEDTQVFTVKKI